MNGHENCVPKYHLPAFAQCENCKKHGYIRLTDGTDHGPVFSVKSAEDTLRKLEIEGKVSQEEALHIADTILSSDLLPTELDLLNAIRGSFETRLEEAIRTLLGDEADVEVVVVASKPCGKPDCPNCKGRVDLSGGESDPDQDNGCQSFGA